MNEIKQENNQILNQHSALTTFKLVEGKYYSINVEKTTFSILEKMQKNLRNEFKEIYSDTYKKLGLNKKEIKLLTDNAFKNKELTVEENRIDKEALRKLAIEIKEYHINIINKISSSEKEKKNLLKEINETALLKLANNQMQVLITPNLIDEMLIDIKDYCKETAIKKCIEETTIDFTMLANTLKANSTILKKQLKNAVGTVLQFNYIDRKKLKVDVTSTLLSSVKFTHDKKNNRTWMTFQIPQEILRLLLMPEVYVPLVNVAVNQIEGTYTYRMYGLFEDHMKLGWIELSKEELFTFLSLPKSYQNKNNLVKYVIDPTLKDIERVSGIHATYEFLPNHAWDKIKFTLKHIKNIRKDEIPILTKEEKVSITQNDIIFIEIEKAKKNVYVSGAWNKRVDNKIIKLYKEHGEKYTVYILRSLYKNLKSQVKTTLVQYINGIMKKINTEEVDKVIINKKEHIEEAVIIEENKKEQVKTNNDFIYNLFLQMNENARVEIEKKAEEMYKTDTNTKTISGVHEKAFEKSKKTLIIKILNEKFNG